MPNTEKQNKQQNEYEGRELKGTPATGTGREARAVGERPLPVPVQESMGLSVTPHREITKKEANPRKDYTSNSFEVKEWNVLSQGIDTLDLGLGVVWGNCWENLSVDMEQGKKDAVGHDLIFWKKWNEEEIYISPGGKPPQYRYHLLCSVGHVFIGKSDVLRESPNIYVSFHAASLWLLGWRKCLLKVAQCIRFLGGKICYIKPSRVDLCVDCHVPGGLTNEFLKSHLVSHSRENSQHFNGESLGTFYLGHKKSPVQLRIYDKTEKSQKDNMLPLFWEVWGKSLRQDVWRVEYQLRRPFLQQFNINTMGALRSRLGSIWNYLTEDWCSLRLLDDTNVSRRSIHPFWKAVQESFQCLDACLPLERRQIGLERPSLAWYVAHIAGCLTSYGAFLGYTGIKDALKDLTVALQDSKLEKEYDAALRLKISKFARVGISFKKIQPKGWK